MSRMSNGEKKADQNVAVAIDKDKGSQFALKWAVDQLLSRGQTLTLLHVKPKSSSSSSISNQSSSDGNDENGRPYNKQLDGAAKELFLPFRCFCTRKEIKVNEVVVEDGDIAKAITEYVNVNIIDTLILGAPSRSGLVRKFKITDVPSTVSKSAPDFCTVYVIAKGKISSVRSASCTPPPKPSPPTQNVVQLQQNKGSSTNNNNAGLDTFESYFNNHNQPYRSVPMQSLQEEIEIKSPFNRARNSTAKSYGASPLDNDISFVSSGRPSMDRMPLSDSYDSGFTPRISTNTDRLSNSSEHDFKDFGSLYSGNRSVDFTSHQDYSSSSNESGKAIWSSQNMEDVEAEMRRLRLELKQTMDMYSSACKEALTAKQKARELHRWKLEEQQKLEDARLAEEAALALVEKEKAKSKAAIEAAQAAQRLAELESQKRINAELKAMRDAEERNKAMHSMNHVDIRYRKYSIEEIEAAAEDFAPHSKIGEGGYGPVYKAYLDHTQVAIKVLRPDAAQGRSQFQQEVEVLSCIRHPNMVLLLGACPEYGCLVYEYMANGSLDDRLFRRGGTPPLSWQVRFRISAEIATGLLFLHQTKPEPLVHRDLKPGNILLDRNYVSKISDVGLARLVPPSVADSVTQYRMTSTAGTFCYIDPEYQQTGMLGIKSDIYSLGIMLLQIITAKPPMGLTHHVERAIEKGTFREVLDPAVPDWPYEETLSYAKIALQCAELRKRDRPDLGKLVLPVLNRLRALGEENMPNVMFVGSANSSPNHSRTSSIQEMMSGPDSGYGYESSKSRSSTSSYGGRR